MVVGLSATRLLSGEKSGNGSDVVVVEVGEMFIVALVLTLALLALPIVFFVISREDARLAWKVGLFITAVAGALIAAVIALFIEAALSEIATPFVTLVGGGLTFIGLLCSWSLLGLIWKLVKSEYDKARGIRPPGADGDPAI